MWQGPGRDDQDAKEAGCRAAEGSWQSRPWLAKGSCPHGPCCASHGIPRCRAAAAGHSIAGSKCSASGATTSCTPWCPLLQSPGLPDKGGFEMDCRPCHESCLPYSHPSASSMQCSCCRVKLWAQAIQTFHMDRQRNQQGYGLQRVCNMP